MKQIVFHRRAVKDRRQVPSAILQRIDAALAEYARGPEQARNVRKLKGQDALRLRVGDWRVIFRDGGDEIIVQRIAHRREAYR